VPTEEEIQKIIELWDLGKSYSEIANQLNGKRSTVQGWIESLIKRGRIVPRTNGVCTAAKKATNARIECCLEKRIALIDAGMMKLEELLPGIDKPSGMRDWYVALGVAIDKRRLEQPNGTVKSGLAEIREKLKAEREELKNVGDVSA
jgi:hypothetical protein